MLWNRRAASLALMTVIGACAVPGVGPKGTTVAVKLQTGAFLTQAARKTAADIDHYHLKLISTATNTVVSQADTTAQQTQFTQVPDGTYVLKADALDNTGHSIVQGGEQLSVNNAAVVSPNVTYSDNAGCLTVNLHLLDATGETINNHINVTDGSVWNGTPVLQVGGTCACLCFGNFPTLADRLYTIVNLTGSFNTPGHDMRDTSANIVLDVTTDSNGNIIYADGGSGIGVRMVPRQDGTYYGQTMQAYHVYTIASSATINLAPNCVKVDQSGNVFIADFDFNNPRIAIVPSSTGSYFGQPQVVNQVGTVATLPRTEGNMEGVAVDTAGNLFYCNSTNVYMKPKADGNYFGQAMLANTAYRLVSGTGFAGDNGPVNQARIDTPNSVSVDPQGNLYISDTGNHRVRMVAAVTGNVWGQSVTAGNIYTVVGGGTATGDGIAANQAKIQLPEHLRFDAAGNMFVPDPRDEKVRMIPRQTGAYYGQNMTANAIYTVVGNGVATRTTYNGTVPTTSPLYDPYGVAVDAGGNIFIANTYGFQVDMVSNGNCP